MSEDENEYGEHASGYTTEYPPLWSRPFIEEFDLEIKSCGYNLGMWVEVQKEDRQFKIRRLTTGDIYFPAFGSSVKIHESLPSESFERDKMIKRIVEEKLEKCDSFEDLVGYDIQSD